jgi:GH24 family phage-related lysozyme (muramidase)
MLNIIIVLLMLSGTIMAKDKIGLRKGKLSDEESFEADRNIRREESVGKSLDLISTLESNKGKNRKVEPIGNTRGTFHIKPGVARSLDPELKGRSDSDVRELLANDSDMEAELAEKYIRKIQLKVDHLPVEKQTALISFGYNVGPRFVNRILDVQGDSGDAAAASKMREFNKSKVKVGKEKKLVVSNGLVKRRKLESNMFHKEKAKVEQEALVDKPLLDALKVISNKNKEEEE